MHLITNGAIEPEPVNLLMQVLVARVANHSNIADAQDFTNFVSWKLLAAHGFRSWDLALASCTPLNGDDDGNSKQFPRWKRKQVRELSEFLVLSCLH